jgi:predicted phage tail protein
MDDLTELWVDVSFPQGLVWYDNGTRKQNQVMVRVDIRRPGATAAQVSINETFTDSTSGPLRWTRRYTADSLTAMGLPAGTGYEVSLQRTNAILPDTATQQYIDDTVWQALSAMRMLPPHLYPDLTVLQLSLSNTRAAVSLGETSFNCIATRKLPTWNGSAWSAPAPSRKWADNFVARCKASDGANKSDAQIDLAGIYALQAQLDAQDGGAQGEISLTLDQQQDMDSELALLAAVIRSVVYRVGRKVYVTRDQANATTIALFNARTKGPDGETSAVRLTSDSEQDGVIISWLDEAAGFKLREFTYPQLSLATNLLRVDAPMANWAQAYRRALYEWNRLKYRRENLTCAVTEDGRIVRPGDVVGVTDDVANLASAAGEVLNVSGLVLTLDRDVAFTAGTHSILLRDVGGVQLDTVPCTVVAGSANRVNLSRAPAVTIKGRDRSRGTLFAFFNDAAATVRPWLVQSVELAGPYVQLLAVNYSPKVYQGDGAALAPAPTLGAYPQDMAAADAQVEA